MRMEIVGIQMNMGINLICGIINKWILKNSLI